MVDAVESNPALRDLRSAGIWYMATGLAALTLGLLCLGGAACGQSAVAARVRPVGRLPDTELLGTTATAAGTEEYSP